MSLQILKITVYLYYEGISRWKNMRVYLDGIRLAQSERREKGL